MFSHLLMLLSLRSHCISGWYLIGGRVCFSPHTNINLIRGYADSNQVHLHCTVNYTFNIPMFSMMTLDISQSDWLQIVVQFKTMILRKCSKHNFSLNSIYTLKYVLPQAQPYYLNYLYMNLTSLVVSQWMLEVIFAYKYEESLYLMISTLSFILDAVILY